MSELVPGSADEAPGYGGIHGDIVALLEAARHTAARSVNALMTASYWEIGRRIVEFEQGGRDRAAYGQVLLKRLSVDLTNRFGRGFSERNLEQMRLFYQAWPAEQISQTPSAKLAGLGISQTKSGKSADSSISASPIRRSAVLGTSAQALPLPWSAYVRLLSVKNPSARAFYETEALRCGWSVRQLDRQVNSQFYERIALSRNKAAMLQKAELAESGDAITPEQALKDPFVLEFLNLKDEYSESDLESALIQHWPISCWNWATTLPLWGGSGACGWTTVGFASICCFSTAGSVACWSSTSRLASSAMPTRARCTGT